MVNEPCDVLEESRIRNKGVEFFYHYYWITTTLTLYSNTNGMRIVSRIHQLFIITDNNDRRRQ